MKYLNTLIGTFISRPNRFIANIEINGKEETAHVKNTGRCKELLIPGVKVVLQRASNEERKTKYDLIAVWKEDVLINIDSQAPNQAFYEYLKTGSYIKNITYIKPETKYGNSRIDFYVETKDKKIFIEVKGVSLEENEVVLFPDAPTQRGVKHLNELAMSIKDGYEAHVVFVAQMKKAKYFTPNNKTHPEFGITLKNVNQEGVKVTCFTCDVTSDSLVIDKEIPVKLDN